MKWSDLEQLTARIPGATFEPDEPVYRAEMRVPGKCIVTLFGQPGDAGTSASVAIDAEVAPASIPAILRASNCTVSASVALCGDSDDVVELNMPNVRDERLLAALEVLGVEVLEAGGQS